MVASLGNLVILLFEKSNLTPGFTRDSSIAVIEQYEASNISDVSCNRSAVGGREVIGFPEMLRSNPGRKNDSSIDSKEQSITLSSRSGEDDGRGGSFLRPRREEQGSAAKDAPLCIEGYG